MFWLEMSFLSRSIANDMIFRCITFGLICWTRFYKNVESKLHDIPGWYNDPSESTIIGIVERFQRGGSGKD